MITVDQYRELVRKMEEFRNYVNLQLQSLGRQVGFSREFTGAMESRLKNIEDRVAQPITVQFDDFREARVYLGDTLRLGTGPTKSVVSPKRSLGPRFHVTRKNGSRFYVASELDLIKVIESGNIGPGDVIEVNG